LYPHHAGIGLNTRDNNEPGYTGRLTNRTVTIPEVLQSVGYQSFVSGKWHLSHWDYDDPYSTMHPPSWPLQRGFDGFYGTLSGAGSYFSPVSLMSDNEFIEPGDDFYYTDQINDQAVRFIEESDPDSPIFLYISHVAPHWPLHALQQDIDKYDGVFNVGWDVLRKRQVQRQIEEGLIDEKWVLTERDHRVPSWNDADHKEWEAHRKAVYAAQIDNMDQGIGRVIESLKKLTVLKILLYCFSRIMEGTPALFRVRIPGMDILNGVEPDLMFFPVDPTHTLHMACPGQMFRIPHLDFLKHGIMKEALPVHL
jgi:arylsulfatase A-like enzyme